MLALLRESIAGDVQVDEVGDAYWIDADAAGAVVGYLFGAGEQTEIPTAILVAVVEAWMTFLDYGTPTEWVSGA